MGARSGSGGRGFPIQVVHEFEIRGPIISGNDNDPGFMIAEVDKGSQGWYLGPSNKKYPGEFSIPDPKTVTATSIGTDWITKQGDTLLDGTGNPVASERVDAGMKIGEGPIAGVHFTTSPPADRIFQGLKRQGAGEAVILLFIVEREIDFGPLIAGL